MLGSRRNFIGGLAGIFGIGAADAVAKSAISTAADVSAMPPADTAKPMDMAMPEWVPNKGEPCYEVLPDVRISRENCHRMVRAVRNVLRNDGHIEVLVEDPFNNTSWFVDLANLRRISAPPANVDSRLLGGVVPAGGTDR